MRALKENERKIISGITHVKLTSCISATKRPVLAELTSSNRG